MRTETADTTKLLCFSTVFPSPPASLPGTRVCLSAPPRTSFTPKIPTATAARTKWENYQARVNGLCLGLDNWIYGANGLIGGIIHGKAGGKEVNISGRDFRMHPETGEFEPASGLTQQGRVRDDWDNWFGCDNSTLLWQYPLPDHYVRRNPH